MGESEREIERDCKREITRGRGKDYEKHRDSKNYEKVTPREREKKTMR